MGRQGSVSEKALCAQAAGIPSSPIWQRGIWFIASIKQTLILVDAWPSPLRVTLWQHTTLEWLLPGGWKWALAQRLGWGANA